MVTQKWEETRLKGKVKMWITILVMSLFFFLGADTVSAKSLSGLKINRSNIEMAVGSLYQLKATVKASGSKIIWKSNNTDIVTVSTTGKLKAKKAGNAVITVKCRNEVKKCTVNVKIATIKQLEGYWEIDTDMTMKINKTSMRWIYGSAFSQYGSIMEFKRNGEFSYGVGAGNGGAGKFSIKNNYIKYRIIKYEDNAVEQKSIKVKKINSQNIRLIIKDGKYKIYWKKKS